MVGTSIRVQINDVIQFAIDSQMIDMHTVDKP
jgi:hypothetical protein